MIDDEIRGLLASIGISKGTTFAPDDRMRALLTEAVAVANGTARAISFKTRDPEAYKYPNSRWKTGFIGDDYRWLIDDGVGGRNLDARTLFFYLATVNTPAMALHIPGVGSQYAYTEHDSAGEYLDGGKDYELTVPPNVPAKDFWSVVLYDPQTRSELQTGQAFPSKNNTRDALAANPDGSITLTFGPKAPDEKPRQLDTNRSRQEVVHHPAALRSPRALVRQDVDPRRNRTASLKRAGGNSSRPTHKCSSVLVRRSAVMARPWRASLAA